MKRLFTFFLATFVVMGFAHAQTPVKGRVTDASGETLPGVSVYIKGTSTGSTTDGDGAFQLTIPAGSENGVLVFSFIGYVTQEISLTNRTDFSITLQEDAAMLNEVVVTGYTSQEKTKITGAISTVTSEELNKVPVPTIDQALQGRAAGVSVTQNTGAPGEGVSIRIRGVGSINSGNSPLYIVDGIPTQDIGALSMQDVADISILKDASMSAQYGSRATNGVVIITTKAGKEGVAKIQFDTQIGFQKPTRLIKMANKNQYAEIYNEAANNDNAGVTNPLFLRPLITEAMLNDMSDVDHVDAILQNGVLQTHTLSVSGGDEKTKYFISGNYFQQEGIIKSSDFTRLTGRANIESQVKPWLKVGTNLNISKSHTNFVGSSGDGAGGNGGSVVRYAFFRTPGIPVYDASGNFVDMPQYPTPLGDGYNPVGMLAYNENERTQKRMFGKFFAELNLAKNLKLTSNLGIDLLNEDARRFDRTWGTLDRINNVNRLLIGENNFQGVTWSNFLTYTHNLGENHTISYLLGAETIQNDWHSVNSSQKDFADQERNLVYLGMGQGLVESFEGATGSSLASFFAKVDYDYADGKYIASGMIRRDGSSRFGPGNRWGTFYAGSLGWRIDREGFLMNSDVIDLLKLRVGYGVIGNQEIGDYRFIDQIGSNYNYSFNSVRYIGYAVSRMGNADLKWESSNQFNVGIDFGFFNGKLTGSLDYFNKITTDLLVSRPLPGSAGLVEAPIVNDGKILNRGLELALSYNNKIGNDFTYSITANAGTLHNEVLELSTPYRQGRVGSDYLTFTEVGHPVGSFYLYEMAGIFQSASEIFSSALPMSGVQPGDVKYVDQGEGDGVIDGNDRVHVGSPIPKVTAGLTINLAYKGFDLSIFFQGAYGQKIFSVLNRDLEGFYRGFNVTERYYENRWTGPGTSNEFPRASWNASGNNTIVYSDRFLEDGSFTRLKNLQLGYTFPKTLLNNYGIGNLRVYFSGTNLLTFTKYQGLDPEMTASDNAKGVGDMANGIDWGTYPSAKSYNVGLSLTF